MAEQGPETMRDFPRVILAQRVVDKITRGALLYPEPETGEALIGLIVLQAGRSEPDIYVLDTIGPGEGTVREWGMFEHGDDWQADVFQWMHVNWESFRELRRPSYGNAIAAKWDVALMHVGDWHKQPGDMIEPSGGDAQTARRMINDVETPLEHIIAPIVTMYPLNPVVPNITDLTPVLPPAGTDVIPAETKEETPPENPLVQPVTSAADNARMPDQKANSMVIRLEEQGWSIRIDFWYASKRVKPFVGIAPTVWANDRLPGLPPLAWHLAYPKRFEQELGLLTEAGYMVDIVRWDADGKPPYEIAFSVYKPGSNRVILLITPVDYPTHSPAIRLAPLVSVAENEDVFEKLYAASQPVLLTQMPTWEWDSKRTLIELVWHIEKTLQEDNVK